MSLNWVISLLVAVTLVEMMLVGLGVRFSDVIGVARAWLMMIPVGSSVFPAALLPSFLLPGSREEQTCM